MSQYTQPPVRIDRVGESYDVWMAGRYEGEKVRVNAGQLMNSRKFAHAATRQLKEIYLPPQEPEWTEIIVALLKGTDVKAVGQLIRDAWEEREREFEELLDAVFTTLTERLPLRVSMAIAAEAMRKVGLDPAEELETWGGSDD